MFLVIFIFLSVGEKFHEETKESWSSIIKEVLRFEKKPSLYKTYSEVPKIELPQISYEGRPLMDCIKERRSYRNYSQGSLTLEEISILLNADAITLPESNPPFRAAPSAGALYPIEIYLVVNDVTGLENGIYHYSFREHSLEFIKKGDFRGSLFKASMYQEMVRDAPVVFILTAIFKRVTWKYGDRGYRYAYMEAGHISQNIYLIATSLGLGTVVVGAFIDDEVNRILGIDGKREAALYLQPVGRR